MSSEDHDPTIDIGRDGDLQGFSRAARRRLALASGRYRLLPSPTGLLIFERIEPGAPSDKPAPAVALAGEIAGPGSLADVLNFIHFNQWDGMLTVVAEPARKTLYFQKGQVQSARSNLVEDRLGELLVRFGRITAEQLVDCVREVTPERRLGTILVERNLLGTHELYEGVRRQMEEIFHSMLLLRRGAFYFTRETDEPIVSRLHLDTQALLLESLRRTDEMAYFRTKLPSPDVVLGRRPASVTGSLAGDVLRVYDLVDDRRTLAEIARDSKLGEFAATKAAFELVQRGMVAVREAAALVRDKGQTILPDQTGALVDAYSGGLRRLQHMLAAHGKRHHLADAVAAFTSGSARFADIMEGVHLDEDGALPRAQVVANVGRLPPQAGITRLREALAELLLFVLFVAHDDIDRAQEQEIHEHVVRAVERLGGR